MNATPLLAIYLEALERCAPERLVADFVSPDLPRNIVAIGKCAGALFDGLAAHAGSAFVALPEGYRAPSVRHDDVEVAFGGHPDYTPASFAAGERLLEFVDTHDDILYVISGGGSACVEVPFPPFTAADLARVNARLVASGIPIGAINSVRKQLSAIKGGKLAARTRGRCATLVYSDVPRGALADVASGPTLPDAGTPADAARILETIGGCDDVAARLKEVRPHGSPPARSCDARLVADNDTLVETAADIASARGFRIERLEPLERDVETVAQLLAERARRLAPGELLACGGEPTVVRHGDGRGGRCSELAVRFARLADHGIAALFASSDGVDGSTGVAGFELVTGAVPLDPLRIESDLARSDSYSSAAALGRPIIIPAAGNNLRDLYLLARRWQAAP